MRSYRGRRMQKLAKLLFFRLDPDECRELGARDATLGVLCAWIAGIGRCWDHPTAGAAPTSGAGSVVYVFALSALLSLLLLPLRSNRQEVRDDPRRRVADLAARVAVRVAGRALVRPPHGHFAEPWFLAIDAQWRPR